MPREEAPATDLIPRVRARCRSWLSNLPLTPHYVILAFDVPPDPGREPYMDDPSICGDLAAARAGGGRLRPPSFIALQGPMPPELRDCLEWRSAKVILIALIGVFRVRNRDFACDDPRPVRPRWTAALWTKLNIDGFPVDKIWAYMHNGGPVDQSDTLQRVMKGITDDRRNAVQPIKPRTDVRRVRTAEGAGRCCSGHRERIPARQDDLRYGASPTGI